MYFNVRVYGILVNAKNEVLISDEREYGIEFSKFPGGGLEYGEGLIDGLIREFREECDIDIEVIRHVHTTDVFCKSAFNDSQVIAVYYLVTSKQPPKGRFVSAPFDFEDDTVPNQVFRWVRADLLTERDLSFEIDRTAWHVFLSEKRHGLDFLQG